MKEYTLSNEEKTVLVPWESVRAGLEAQIKSYIARIVLPRIGVKPGERQVMYDILGGKVTVGNVIKAKGLPKKKVVKKK